MTEKDLDSSNNKYIEKSKPNDKQSEWDIAIGLQQVDNLKPSKYLKEISEEEYELYESLGEQDYIHYKKNEAAVEKLYQQQQQQTPVIICPMCHMPSGEKISTTRRVVSTTALGLASSDIGKQYRCKSCGHKW